MIYWCFFHKNHLKSLQSMKYVSFESIFEMCFHKNHQEIMILMKKKVRDYFSLFFTLIISTFPASIIPTEIWIRDAEFFENSTIVSGQETKYLALPMKSRQERWTMMDFSETWASFTSHSSELPRTWKTLRYNFNTYSRRSRECREPYPARMAGRATFFERHSEIFQFWPIPEHVTTYLWCAHQ